MSSTHLAVLSAIAAVSLCPLAAAAQTSGSLDRALADLRGPDGADPWRDAAHRRDRLDAVPGYPEFADQEAAIRASLDAGLAQGWLDRNDFLIFGRQLHQTELLEARDLRLYGDNLSDTDRDLILGELTELRGQLDDTRRMSVDTAQR